LRGYYSVFDPDGKKIADCGIERDAVTLIGMRNARWDGHYYTFIPLPGDIVDVNMQQALPTFTIEAPARQPDLHVEYIEVHGQKIYLQQSDLGVVAFSTSP
tara:strand:+ start:85 stop:387 length:303 start_codon:yes stop_codon:yes gene_type:complete